MRGNYFGVLGEKFKLAYSRLGSGEILTGIPGSPADHHSVPFAMTEEFAACNRLHSLMPDQCSLPSPSDDVTLLAGVFANKVRNIYTRCRLADAAYSFGTSHPGALVLHNYPETLRRLDKRQGDGIFIDLATVDILRDRERGIPRHCAFRRHLGMKVPKSFAELTDDQEWRKDLASVYAKVEDVDLLIGTLAESWSREGTPPGFGFSDTVLRIFIQMASRRLKSDRFFTEDFRPDVYTPAGFRWVQENSLGPIIERQLPELADSIHSERNVFFPWKRAGR